MFSKSGLSFCAAVFFILSLEVNSDLNVTKASQPRTDQQPWWIDGVFYQIYPRSFKDSNYDGIGDLIGITNQLQHLKDTGITAVWLSQIYMTPGTEHGEGISNFRDIHADYGTLTEFDDLIVKAKRIGIKVILDFVLNHSGKQHPWFIQSEENKNGDYKDFYVWHNGIDGNEENKLPPNNWLSVYGDSAWEWSETRQQFYLHQFGIEQPDLNYAHPQVIEEMKSEMTFWLKRGVDGFRLDAIPFLFEDDRFENEPESNNPNVSDYEHQYLNHIYTMDQTKTYDLIYKLRKFIDNYNADNSDETPKILMAEAYTSIENTIKYYGDAQNKGVHVPFNFQLIPHNKDSNAITIVSSINEWLNKMPDGQIANWLVGNHDHHRAATRFGPELANNINILIASLPGVMVTYNGEEIGQEDGEVTYVQCKDPIGCRNGPADFSKVSRDFERTPYHWDETKNAGFTDSAVEPWLPVSSKHAKTNLKEQKEGADSRSSFKIYKYIISELRKLNEFTTGEVKVEADSENVIKVTRGSSSTDNGNYIVVINMGNQKAKLKVADDQKGLYYKVIYSTDISITEQYIWEKDVTIDAYNTVVLKVVSKDVTYDWWKHAVIYQIYLRSFKDEINNDGIGDLRGIISKLEYLKELGVNAICLSSIYESSQRDLGYDVTDFQKIDEIYGTKNDFIDLIKFANYHGIRVIIDFVPNHSGINHRWFTEKPNYYVTTSKPANNWLSIFKGKAWTGTSASKYLHQFDISQPDLNYRTSALRNEMKDILTFWLETGISGFRMTSVPYLFEDEAFPNEPPANHLAEDKDTWKSLRHIYTSNLQETFDLIYDWRNLLDIYTAENGGDERIMIADANTDIHNTMYYYGTKDKKGAHLTFNFQFMEKVDDTSTANDFAAKINEWIDLIPEGFTSNWALGNHDNRRVATRFRPENVDGFNMLTAILPGVMVTYNGEEIGQEDGVLEVNNCDGDPIFCPIEEQTEAEIENLRERRRDRQRTPFHWDSSLHAGFTKSKKGPWLPVGPKYAENNLQLQINQTRSHYELYRRLLKLRQKPAFVSGSLKVKAVTDYVLASLRYYTANESYFHLLNLRNEKETFNLRSAYNETSSILEVVETNDHANLPVGTRLDVGYITLQGYQSVIAKFIVSGSTPTIYAASSFVILLGLVINIINFS